MDPIVERLERAGFAICRKVDEPNQKLVVLSVADAAAALAAEFRNDAVLPHEMGDE